MLSGNELFQFLAYTLHRKAGAALNRKAVAMRQVIGRIWRTAGRQCFAACLLVRKAKLCHKAAGTQHTQRVLMEALLSVTYSA